MHHQYRLADKPIPAHADLCEKIITYESFRLPEFCCESKIDSQTSEILNLWNLIVCQRKIISSFHNVTVYWSHFGLTSELLSFIISEKESLCSQSDLSADNKLIQDIISSDIDDNSFSYFIHRFSIESPDFPFWDLSESKLSIMIDCNYFPFTIDGYLKLKAKSKALSLEYIGRFHHGRWNKLIFLTKVVFSTQFKCKGRVPPPW